VWLTGGDEARMSPSVWFGAYQRATAGDASDLGQWRPVLLPGWSRDVT